MRCWATCSAESTPDPREAPPMMDSPQSTLVAPPAPAHPVRAWLALVWLSLQRQARMRQMIWMALGLLFFSVLLVAFITSVGDWTIRYHRIPFREGPTLVRW